MESVILTSNPKRLAASGAAWNGPGALAGIFVASTSGSPTIQVFDSLAGSGAILVNTFTPVAATWYPMPFLFSVGCFVVIGGTVDCTVGIGPISS